MLSKHTGIACCFQMDRSQLFSVKQRCGMLTIKGPSNMQVQKIESVSGQNSH